VKRLNEKPVGRWAINIDLEGFGHLYGMENLVLLSLGELMEGIFRIGTQYYPESPDRISAHQIGDGFVIVSNFQEEETFLRPLAIAISLLRHVAHSGRYAKATISDGDFADILSCYPTSVIDAAGPDKRVRLGRGIMTLFPVMGTALIRAISVAKKCPSGPLLGNLGRNLGTPYQFCQSFFGLPPFWGVNIPDNLFSNRSIKFLLPKGVPFVHAVVTNRIPRWKHHRKETAASRQPSSIMVLPAQDHRFSL
jgi:hypothetical protein